MTQPPDFIADRYRVRAVLGQGGMGVVYRVHDERDDCELALKQLTLRGEHAQMATTLFEREFLTLSELAHPRVVQVCDYGVDPEGPYYTMELLPGEDLRTLGKQPWQRACELLRDLASSLAILHSRRLLHNDVSPRNVRCTPDGRAKLIDFGAMSAMGVNKRIVGTPPFTAPETLNQQALDGRSDLYALGALAYGLMT
ncbi:MAG: serine/threonine-protein kinase, partial [Polyangiales bacterium]